VLNFGIYDGVDRRTPSIPGEMLYVILLIDLCAISIEVSLDSAHGLPPGELLGTAL
jgi:hypothetical protein